jgi:hypothetical protein
MANKEKIMKTRNGFVSNSSSSSFVICKEFLTKKKLDAIRKWYTKDRDIDQCPGDNGDYFKEDDNYISAEVFYIRDDFDKICIRNEIDISKIFWLEE